VSEGRGAEGVHRPSDGQSRDAPTAAEEVVDATEDAKLLLRELRRFCATASRS
jgi:hypothetical protein